jgi:cardiolipin synthase
VVLRDRLTVKGVGTRRRFTALTLATLFSRCAEVPDIGGLTSGDIGLGSREHLKPAQPLTQEQALQRQYDLQRALSAVPIVPGNEVKLLSGGADTYAAMFAALQTATSSINLEISFWTI